MRNTPTSSPAPWALEGSLFHLRLFMPWPLGGKLVKHYLHLHGLLLKNVFYNVIANTGFIHFQIIFFPLASGSHGILPFKSVKTFLIIYVVL